MTDKDRIKDAMREALNEWALGLGVDVTSPSSKLEVQADFRHLRRWRLLVEGGGLKAAYTMVTLVVTALLGALWLGIQAIISKS